MFAVSAEVIVPIVIAVVVLLVSGGYLLTTRSRRQEPGAVGTTPAVTRATADAGDVAEGEQPFAPRAIEHAGDL